MIRRRERPVRGGPTAAWLVTCASKCAAVAMSDVWTASGPGVGREPGTRPSLIPCMPCWAAKVAKQPGVDDLSPLLAPEVVKPAASLSWRHRR